MLAATDFFTVEVWTFQGLVTHYVLFFIELATRSVHIAGLTTNPNGLFMRQVGRNLTDIVDGFLLGKRYFILDRDTKYSEAFRALLEREGINIIRLPPKSPNLNAYSGAIRSLHQGRDAQSTSSSSARPRYAAPSVNTWAHYHTERNHQGMGNRLIAPSNVVALRQGVVQRRDRLGGMLRCYHREAA